MRPWFQSRSIRTQITALAIGPLLLVTLLAIVTQPLTLRDFESTSYAKATAIRIEAVADQVRVSNSPTQVAAILDAVSRTGLRVETVPASELALPLQPASADRDVRNLVRDNLPDSLKPVLRDRTRDGAFADVILVRANDDTALAFAPAPSGQDALINDIQVDRVLMGLVVVLPVMLLSLYASRMITAPLTRFVDAAQALDPDDGPEKPFEENGPLEMVRLANSLNEMRGRIHDMLEDRTRMLRAISHDLRTPLTRLRLRADKSAEPELRLAMLNDIHRIDEMIDETLTFLRKDVSAEELTRADLPSLLQTVCTDFSDIGFAASYEGPERFAYPCKPQALARAVSNLVDNGTKFARTVVVRLSTPATGAVEISVSDDGPGVAEDLRRRVLEPFFKANTARTPTERGGFGLGLSIVQDIVRSHNGSLHLIDSPSGGLMVSLNLPVPARESHAMKTTQVSILNTSTVRIPPLATNLNIS